MISSGNLLDEYNLEQLSRCEMTHHLERTSLCFTTLELLQGFDPPIFVVAALLCRLSLCKNMSHVMISNTTASHWYLFNNLLYKVIQSKETKTDNKKLTPVR